ncbi:MAG: CRISPR-associated helicase Cas3' [Sandaracinaceae bacterium]|nr:CRISPR-associated helicase Cas3' [Sandaracinaceae bacterium]
MHGVLLAKSTGKRAPVTLEEHLLDTERAADCLFRPGSRWLTAFVRFFGLHAGDADRFRTHLRIAALAHDLGKANGDFQKAMRQPGTRQSIRHEHLSTLFLHHPRFVAWARTHDLDHDAICAAVLSHHLKAGGPGRWALCQPLAARDVRLAFGHAEVTRVLDRMAVVLDASAPSIDPLPERFMAEEWQEVLAAADAAARRYGRDRTDRRRLGWALKVGVIAADSVASAMVREGHDIEGWIEDAAHSRAITGEDVEKDIVSPRIGQIRSKGGSFQPRDFQERAAELPSRALLLAGCGSGKTMAAWRWAQRQLDFHPAGRVVFLYPTRGTATEGFRDYVGWAPEGSAELLHGTARFELDAMRANPPESLDGKRLVDETAARLFALGVWPKRYFSATVDQFLSFMENRYESLCLVPVLADAIVIFDEVHSYDARMFENLVAFLEHFDVPALAMTATLPPRRAQQLVERGLRLYPQPEERAELDGLVKAENHPRYRMRRCAGEDEALARAIAAHREGKRVLWVVNVVRRCQALAGRLATELGVEVGAEVLAYHSRFKLEDRRRAHDRTISAFQRGEGAAIAVTTQVCEMSLDLDADVLISEIAPISSLVQRLGRANRHLRHGESFRAEVVLYAPESNVPYDVEDLDAAERFLEALPDEPSQHVLALELDRHAPMERAALMDAARFLTGGYYALPGDFRDTDDFGRRCILDTDMQRAVALVDAREPIDGLIVSVPKRYVEQDAPRPLPRMLGIASACHYDVNLGFVEPNGGEL